MANNELITVKALTDHHLEEYLRCPYKFYISHIRKIRKTKNDWRHVVQHAVNRIIQEYYQLHVEGRSSSKVLGLIEKHWNVNVRFFDSKVHYYMILAKATDYLLQWLNHYKSIYPPVFLFEKFSTSIEELQINLSITFQIGEWSKKSFIIKKVLVDDNEGIIQSYKNLTIVFCQQAFQTIPERIEIYCLSTGQTYIFYPKSDDVKSGMQYLTLIKNLLGESKNYIKTNSIQECNSCPFKDSCHPVNKLTEKPIKIIM